MITNLRSRQLLACLGITLLGAASNPAVPLRASGELYDVIDLGTLGGNQSVALGINDSNQVVGYSKVATGERHAFLYQNGTMIDLGVLPGSGSDESFAEDINNSGVVVGQSGVSPPIKAFMYSGGILSDLGSLGGEDVTVAHAINEVGEIVGASRADGRHRAFRTSPYSAINPLTDDLANNVPANSSVALGINNAGVVVGQAYFAPGSDGHAFATAPHAPINPTTDDLGTLGGYSYARGVNGSGLAVGDSRLPALSTYRAVMFSGGAVTDISPGQPAIAYAVNDAGVVVGTIDGQAAFSYDSANGLRLLTDLIDGTLGWTLSEATAINAHGAIAGFGWHNGQRRAFLLLPRPPADSLAPTASPIATPSANGAGWNNTDVVVTWNWADNPGGAGIDSGSCTPSSTSSGEGNPIALSATCTDLAGNTGNASYDVKVDKTTPTLNPVVSPQVVALYGMATVSSGAADALSGLATQSCDPLVTTSVGLKSVSCTATDHAGNTATVSVGYQVVYAWAGFFQPVDNLPTLNGVKAGRAIPVKFSLAGDQGLGIFAAGYPLSRQIACDSGAPLDDVEQTVAAGSSSLSYDPSSGQYTYVWKTDKTWALTCRQLVINLVDGTEQTANFEFK
jgi:probable HAF family extracellular repeat protein